MSWEQLLAIRDEFVEELANADDPPAACPNDGEPLITGPDGELFCRFDGWPNAS